MPFLTKKWLAILVAVVAIVSCVAVIILVNPPKEKLDNKEDNMQSTIPDDKTDNTLGTVPDETATYTVTFYSNDGTVLKIDSVKEDSFATPPVNPVMTYGMVFKSWDTDFSKVTKDLEIHPVCEEIKGKPNVLAVQSRYSQKGGTVVVPIQLCGDVCVSGLDITVRYDQELLNLKAVTEDKGVMFNDATPGIIKLNYVSTQNTVADVDVCYLQFYVNATEGEIPITIEINGIYAFEDEDKTDVLNVPESTVIDGKIYVVS